MDKNNLVLDLNFADGRIKELAKLAENAGWQVNGKSERNVYVFLPRQPKVEIVKGSLVFDLDKLKQNEEYVRYNNSLTANALMQIMGDVKNKRILLVGHGKLTEQLKIVLPHAKILSFTKTHADYFKNAPLKDFDIIVNTVPMQLITEREIKTITKNTTIYELASAPFGFDFGKLDKTKYNYKIESSLPGRYFPALAAKAIFDVIEKEIKMEKQSIVLAITGSSCCFEKIIPTIEKLGREFNVLPVLSENANKANRFTNITEFKTKLETICGNRISTTIAEAEMFSSNKSIVAVVVCPATGNTTAKLANAITDSPVLMAIKAITRNNKPCIIGVSTNDGLSNNFANIGTLLAKKNYYFVPFNQDDFVNKPSSLVCKFDLVYDAVVEAIKGKQIQPIIYQK